MNGLIPCHYTASNAPNAEPEVYGELPRSTADGGVRVKMKHGGGGCTDGGMNASMDWMGV